MGIDRPPFRVERTDDDGGIRIMLTEPLYKYYGAVSSGTNITGAPEAIIEIREYVDQLLGEFHMAGLTATFCTAGLLAYLIEQAVSVDQFEYVRKTAGWDQAWGHAWGGEYYGAVVTEPT